MGTKVGAFKQTMDYIKGAVMGAILGLGILAICMLISGCTIARSQQNLPVTAGQLQAGQPNILQIQFFPAQSLNARPVHSEAAGLQAPEGLPRGPLGENWADSVVWNDVIIYANVTVSSTGATADQAAAQEGGQTGAVTQTPTTDITPTVSTAVGPGASSSAAGEGATSTSETTPVPPPAPAPEPTPEPTPPPGTMTPPLDDSPVVARIWRPFLGLWSIWRMLP